MPLFARTPWFVTPSGKVKEVDLRSRPRRSDGGHGLLWPTVGALHYEVVIILQTGENYDFCNFWPWMASDGLGWPRRSDLRLTVPHKSKPRKTLPSMIF